MPYITWAWASDVSRARRAKKIVAGFTEFVPNVRCEIVVSTSIRMWKWDCAQLFVTRWYLFMRANACAARRDERWKKENENKSQQANETIPIYIKNHFSNLAKAIPRTMCGFKMCPWNGIGTQSPTPRLGAQDEIETNRETKIEM